MKIVNLFGPPSTGKSTVAGLLFGLLKTHRYEAEFVPEFSKVLTWSNHRVALRDQLYIFGKQHHRLEMLRAQPLEFVVSDGPLLNSIIYQPEQYYKNFSGLVHEVFNSFDNINILLESSHPYSEIGRNEDEAKAVEIKKKIDKLIQKNNIPLAATMHVGPETALHLFTLITGKAPIYKLDSSVVL